MPSYGIWKIFTPNYSEDVLVLGISSDPSSPASEISSHANSRGFTMPLAPFDRSVVIESYRVSSQSSAVGINADGNIVLRKGYGSQSSGEWENWLDTLTGS